MDNQKENWLKLCYNLLPSVVNLSDRAFVIFIKQDCTFTEDLGEISSVAISYDGNFLAVGSCQHPRGNVKVWNLNSGKLIHTLLGNQKPVNCIAISPDGKILASGSNKIKIWNYVIYSLV